MLQFAQCLIQGGCAMRRSDISRARHCTAPARARCLT
ncbi:hypothetical protein E5Q_01148 [Mixia osmundae IAM 14324]|uniref:Uncharacterized protein n=1 Tax=Mixia osmundae (strain CBS 9802 / IAM 14324 / JCM 22182 / KY 12970) TaxID=764103 RepID=G7DV86_MIXOS|nr:hypothetical protein E5Q_01148 [Mixia osmundae IAM 14324]